MISLLDRCGAERAPHDANRPTARAPWAPGAGCQRNLRRRRNRLQGHAVYLRRKTTVPTLCMPSFRKTSHTAAPEAPGPLLQPANTLEVAP